MRMEVNQYKTNKENYSWLTPPIWYPTVICLSITTLYRFDKFQFQQNELNFANCSLITNFGVSRMDIPKLS